jgi:hypothetical protein
LTTWTRIGSPNSSSHSSLSLRRPPSPPQHVSSTMHRGSRTPVSLTPENTRSASGKSASQTASRWNSPACAVLPSAWSAARTTSGAREDKESTEAATTEGPERSMKACWLNSSPARRLRRRRRRRSRRRAGEAGRRRRVSASTSERPSRPSGVLEISMRAARVSSSEQDMVAAGVLGCPDCSFSREERSCWPCCSCGLALRVVVHGAPRHRLAVR